MAKKLLSLTEEQVARYRRDGFLSPLPALEPAEATHYRRALEAYETQAGEPLSRDCNYRIKPHLLCRWANDLVRHPRILDAVEDLIGPNILVFTSALFVKDAHSPTFTAWHQDSTYFGLTPVEHVTAWIALSRASRESGCMLVIPGGPARGQLHHAASFLEHSITAAGQQIVEEIDKSGAVYMELAPGEFSFHHSYCAHSSGPNPTDDRRIGWGISYIPTHVRYTGSTRMPAMLVRGVDTYKHFDLEPSPAADFDDAARAAHDDYLRRHRTGYDEQVKKHEAIYGGPPASTARPRGDAPVVQRQGR